MKKQKEEESKSWKKKWGYLATILVGIVLGITRAIITEKTGRDPIADMGSTNIFIVFISLAVSIFFHIVTHEAGHLIFGLLSGYSFVSFRIGSFTLVHAKNQWKIRRFHIPGTGGQCLMAPPAMDEEGNYPIKLYNLGGILVNLVFSLLFTVLAMVADDPNAKSIFIGAAGMGYIVFLSNGIPMKVGGIANDGYNVLSIDQDPIGKRCFHMQLEVNARLSEGERMKDLPYELVRVEKNSELKNPIIVSGKLFEYYWYVDQLKFDEGECVLKEFEPVWDQMIPLLRNMIAMEGIYLEIIHKNRQEIIEELMTKEVKTYLKSVKYDVHASRVQYGLVLREDSTREQTMKAKEHFLKVIQNNPVEGEAIMSLELANYMEKQLAKEYS